MARIEGVPIERNPYDRGSWKATEWAAGWLDHKHRMEDAAPKTRVQKIRIK